MGELAFGLALHALRDMVARELAVRGYPVGLATGRVDGRRPENRPSDLHRGRVEFLLDAPGPGMTGAALDRRDLRSRDQLQQFARLLADVLDAQVAGYVVGDLAQLTAEVRAQQSVLVARDEVLEGVEQGVAYREDFLVLGEHQGELLLEHQGAR